ncbi:MAG: glycosyltransferase [Deltaproteobacteria bacterium]|nr:glycosyltransferase [Deltaproteobacteria bacterium]
MLNIFYEEPDPDRWFPCDRYPRKIIRRIVRGKPQPGGMMRFFLNLCAGLDILKIPYRINNYSFIKKHPDDLACIIGKPFVLDKIKWKNPIVYGSATSSHPLDDPELLTRLNIKKILVPGQWMKKMCEPAWGDKTVAWAAGIDTDLWAPTNIAKKEIDVLLYDKVRWEYDRYEEELISPIINSLNSSGLTYEIIRYGFYREENFHALLKKSKSMIFLCEHETQGIAYQQALSCNVPLLAWDRGGFWQDPSYYPDKVKFEPVTSVPYWDNRCGMKFKNIKEFPLKLEEFMDYLNKGAYSPRDYILENLTLEKCARHYVRIIQEVKKDS